MPGVREREAGCRVTRPPRDLSLKFLRRLRYSRRPVPTTALAKLVTGRRSPLNAAYLLLRELERLGVVACVGREIRGPGKPAFLWAMAAAATQEQRRAA